MSARLPGQPWVPQSKADTQQMDRDQRQVTKIIKENTSYESTLKTFGFYRLELKKAEEMYIKSCGLEEENNLFLHVFLGQNKN